MEFSTGWLPKPLTGISMLLWPEHTHTSPMSMFSSVTLSPSLMVIVCGSNDAAGVATLTAQRPSASL